MRQSVFSIFDAKVGAFAQPFFMRSSGEAIRAVQAAAQDQQSQLGRTPQDFELWQLGYFEDTEGDFSIHRVCLGNVASLNAAGSVPLVRDPFSQEIGNA